MRVRTNVRTHVNLHCERSPRAFNGIVLYCISSLGKSEGIGRAACGLNGASKPIQVLLVPVRRQDMQSNFASPASLARFSTKQMPLPRESSRARATPTVVTPRQTPCEGGTRASLTDPEERVQRHRQNRKNIVAFGCYHSRQ